MSESDQRSEESSVPDEVSPAIKVNLNPHVVQLVPWLYAAARDAGRSALSTYVRGDRKSQLQAAIAVGAAAEYLGRAVLANVDPVLLARRDSHPSVVMLSRANASGPLDPKVLRSIDASVVWILLERVDQRLRLSAYADVTSTVRNAATHMALVDRPSLEDAAIALTGIVAALHPFLGWDEHEFWGADLAEVVQVLKDEKSNAIQRTVTALIAERRAQLDTLLNGMDVADKLKMVAFLRARDVAHKPSERHKLVDETCPACGNDGVATYGLDEGEPEASYRERSNGDWAEFSWHRDLYPFALEFNCPVCGLRLDDTQFDAAGLPTELESELEYVDDPTLDWEPDEDWARDR